jgi:integrase/recombinase XerD
MSALSGQASDYLRLRRALGRNLDQAHRLLPHLVAYLGAIGAETVTVEAAPGWAQRPGAGPATSVWARRMTVARGFARHMAARPARTPRSRRWDWSGSGSAGARRSSTPPLTSPR